MTKKNSKTTIKKNVKGPVKPTNGKGIKSINGKLANKQLIDALRMMLLARAIDHKAMIFLRQGKTFFSHRRCRARSNSGSTRSSA